VNFSFAAIRLRDARDHLIPLREKGKGKFLPANAGTRCGKSPRKNPLELSFPDGRVKLFAFTFG
jgi:hypothetical protein